MKKLIALSALLIIMHYSHASLSRMKSYHEFSTSSTDLSTNFEDTESELTRDLEDLRHTEPLPLIKRRGRGNPLRLSGVMSYEAFEGIASLAFGGDMEEALKANPQVDIEALKKRRAALNCLQNILEVLNAKVRRQLKQAPVNGKKRKKLVPVIYIDRKEVEEERLLQLIELEIQDNDALLKKCTFEDIGKIIREIYAFRGKSNQNIANNDTY